MRVVHTSYLDNYFNYYVDKSNGGAEFHLGCLSPDPPALIFGLGADVLGG